MTIGGIYSGGENRFSIVASENVSAPQREKTEEVAAQKYSKKDSLVLGEKNTPEEEQKQVAKLKEVDRKVRAHEAAHAAAAGGLVRGGSFTYQTGPDGQRYAVGGEVNIDTSSVAGNAQATVSKMRQVQRAALAPADPSGQDLKVAAQASAEIARAQTENSSPSENTANTSAPSSNSPEGRFYPNFSADKDSSCAVNAKQVFPPIRYQSASSSMHSGACGCLQCKYTASPSGTITRSA